jgi:hypothetical protein
VPGAGSSAGSMLAALPVRDVLGVLGSAALDRYLSRAPASPPSDTSTLAAGASLDSSDIDVSEEDNSLEEVGLSSAL